MRTTDLKQFELLIAEAIKTVGKGDVRRIKQQDPGTLAYKVIEAIDRMTYRSIKDGKEAYISFTSIACTIGASVLAKVEDIEETEQRINTRRYRVGAWLLNQAAEFGIVELNKSSKAREYHTISIQDWDKFLRLTLAMPINLDEDPVTSRPLLAQPEDFKGFRHSLGSVLVRKSNRSVRRYFQRRVMPQVFAAINKQMSVGYKINTALLDELDKLDLSVVCNLEQKNLNGEQRRSIEFAATRVLEQAIDLGDREFWTMLYYDFRSRMYQATSYLNYGGSKLSKNLFLLADAKPLGEHGEKWLKANIANKWKWDKETIDHRCELVEDHFAEFAGWIADIENNLDSIAKADDPYGFIAGVLELMRYYDCEDKDGFTSGLPIAMDMTCSGLQILSLLSEDHISAALCNLLPDTVRGDFYLYIADNIEAFKEDPYWFKMRELRRKLVKRSAMTYFYSCGAKTMGTHIWNDFKSESGFEALTRANCNELGKQIYDACRRLMPGPTALMDEFISCLLYTSPSPRDS